MTINTTSLHTLSAWAGLCLLVLASSCEKPVDAGKNTDGLPSGRQALLTLCNPPIPGAINAPIEGSNLYQANRVELLLRNRRLFGELGKMIFVFSQYVSYYSILITSDRKAYL
ncbi:hypothetical protein ACFSUS_04570 [Spirosoma soli]|uniref:Uncharacterized protein n=1 Tax=Spirosoma soli TaxID=1770529 RepID=A0ABW5LYP0_9BACT